MVGKPWIFKALLMVALCALPGLVFAVEVSVPTKAAGNLGKIPVPSMKNERVTSAPTRQVQAAPAKVEAPPAAAQANPDMTKTVKSLSDQVASLKKELDQLKKSGQTQSKSHNRKRFVR
jgi:hypothetical protein